MSEDMVDRGRQLAESGKYVPHNSHHDENSWTTTEPADPYTDVPPPDEPPADDRDGKDTEPARTWLPVNLDDVLDGTWKPPEPTVGRRNDDVGLFYPGKLHTVSSESEAGKTWFALAAARDEIDRGNHVVYIDFEDDRGPVVGRLLTMGVHPDRIRDYFHYIRPESPMHAAPNINDVQSVLARYMPTLIIIDGVTEAMTLHELDPVVNADVAKFGRMVPP